MNRLLLLLASLGAAASAASAQQTGNARPLTCDPYRTEAVSIRGRIVDDSTGRPVRPDRGVFLGSFECLTGTDSLGEFRFHGVRLGEYRIGIAPLGYRPHAPVPVVVRAGAVSDVGTIRLRPENLVADCLESERCAPLLRPDPVSVMQLDEDERLLEAVLRTSIALAGGDWKAESRRIPCAPDTNRAVFVAIQRRLRNLAPSSDCSRPPSEGLMSNASITHRPSGRPAFSVSVSRIERDGEFANSLSSYYVGPLHAEGWRCRLEREAEGWTPRWCRMAWIS